MRFLVLIAFVFVLLSPAGAVEPFTRLAEARSLPAAEVAKALPMSIRGIVLNRDPDNGSVYLWDGGEAIYATGPHFRELNAQPGDEVLAEGVTTGPGYAPNFKVERVERLGRQPRPSRRDSPPPSCFPTATIVTTWKSPGGCGPCGAGRAAQSRIAGCSW